MPAELEMGDVAERTISSLKKTFSTTKQPAGYFLSRATLPKYFFPNEAAASLHEGSSVTTLCGRQFLPCSVSQYRTIIQVGNNIL